MFDWWRPERLTPRPLVAGALGVDVDGREAVIDTILELVLLQ
jgi:hypothetical protein